MLPSQKQRYVIVRTLPKPHKPTLEEQRTTIWVSRNVKNELDTLRPQGLNWSAFLYLLLMEYKRTMRQENVEVTKSP